jgi:alkylation response protein AidB-like acyl-CoA dehydrogenase
MAQEIADRRDVDFVLYEQFHVEEMQKYPGYEEFNRKTIDIIINEARSFAIKEILPTFAEGDRVGATFNDGKVLIPTCFQRPLELFLENEWNSMTVPEELGGQGLPYLVAQAANDYLIGANCCLTSLGFIGRAAGEMIEIYGTKEQKNLFLKNMYTGKWSGTMVLTESEAGTDVGNLSTMAVKNSDGTYSITGNKIFISGGDHDFTENIIHPVLARIEGAPKGTKGISIFIVPKIWVNEDGSLGEPNDVICTGIEKKMGIHAGPTCSLAFGSKGKCSGFLLGKENEGMKVMFRMMNEARLYVGTLGLVGASSAYLYALNYAKTRLQGRELDQMMNPDAPQVPIIRHPDVRRMLLWMKAHVEGMRSLVYFGSFCVDKTKKAETDKEKAHYQGLLDFLTPIIKAHCSEKAVEVCNQAMQVYGGYGYCAEYPVEQLLRDARIGPIYEGTNGIQAMDMLARKLGMNKGAAFMSYLKEIQKTANTAKKIEIIKILGEKLEKVSSKMAETAFYLGKTAMSPNFKTAFAYASPLLDIIGDLTIAWMLLWRANIAAPKLANILKDNPDQKKDIIEKNKNAAFYEGQIRSAEYFIQSVLPITLGKMDAIKNGNNAVIEIPEVAF